MEQCPVCEIGNEGRAKRRGEKRKKEKKKKEKKSEPDDNRLVKAGWNVYQSVDLSMRVVPQKNMEIYFPPAFRYIRENGKRHGVCRTFVTRLFFIFVFSMHESIGGGRGEFFTGAGYLRCIRRASTFVDMIFSFYPRTHIRQKYISSFYFYAYGSRNV